MNDENSFGRDLARAREAKGLTQTQLGARIGVRQQSVAKWELGIALPSKENLFALSKQLGHFWGQLPPTVNRRIGAAPATSSIETVSDPESELPLRFNSDVAFAIETLLPSHLQCFLNSLQARTALVDYLSDRLAIEIKTMQAKPMSHNALRIQAALWNLYISKAKGRDDRTHCLLLVIDGYDHSPLMQRFIAPFVSDANIVGVQLYVAGSAVAAAEIIQQLEQMDGNDESYDQQQ